MQGFYAHKYIAFACGTHVVPSLWKEGLGVVEKNNVRHFCLIGCDRICLATTPHPSSPEEGTMLGVLPSVIIIINYKL